MSLLSGLVGTATSAASGLSRSLVAARSANPITPTAAGPSTVQAKDSLEISEAARIAEQSAPGGIPTGRNIGGQVSVEEVRAEHQQNIATLDDRLKQLFREHGIKTDPPVRLKTESNGQVVVDGDHPQKAAIEQLFGQQPELRRLLNQISADAGFLQTADVASEFQRRYTEQPVEAIAWLQQLSSAGKSPAVTLQFDSTQLSVEVA